MEDLEKSMVDNYANYTELTKEDMNNIETNLLKLTQSELLKDILAFSTRPRLVVTNTTPLAPSAP